MAELLYWIALRVYLMNWPLSVYVTSPTLERMNVIQVAITLLNRM